MLFSVGEKTNVKKSQKGESANGLTGLQSNRLTGLQSNRLSAF